MRGHLHFPVSVTFVALVIGLVVVVVLGLLAPRDRLVAAVLGQGVGGAVEGPDLDTIRPESLGHTLWRGWDVGGGGGGSSGQGV